MKALIPGYQYILSNFEADGTEDQVIQFIQKEQIQNGGPLETVVNGTTSEEVLVVLINRLEILNQKMHSDYNVEALIHLNQALNSLNARTAERRQKGIEGTSKLDHQ